MKKSKRLFVLCVAVALLIILDQITKAMAANLLKGQQPYIVIGNIFELSYLENTGAAFGSFQKLTTPLSLATFFLIIALVWKFTQIPNGKEYYPLCLSFLLIISGGIGNLIDRIMNGYVVDFLYFVPINFPKFNLADVYITVGASLFFILAVFRYKGQELDFLWKIGLKNKQA